MKKLKLIAEINNEKPSSKNCNKCTFVARSKLIMIADVIIATYYHWYPALACVVRHMLILLLFCLVRLMVS